MRPMESILLACVQVIHRGTNTTPETNRVSTSMMTKNSMLAVLTRKNTCLLKNRVSATKKLFIIL